MEQSRIESMVESVINIGSGFLIALCCIENLQLMTRAEHARHHAIENDTNRIRDEKGRYTNGKELK